MQFRMRAIISNANPSQQYPDTCYVDAVDLDKGKEVQFSTRALRASDFMRFVGRPVLMVGECTIQQRRTGGGYSMIVNSAQFQEANWDELAMGEKPQPAEPSKK